MENKPVVDLNWLCNWLEENSSGIYRPAKEAAHVIRSMSAEIESIRAQLKAAQQSPAVAVPVGWKLVPKMLTTKMYDAIVRVADNRDFMSWPANIWENACDAAPDAPTSPRITEQDAREIINSAVGFMYEEYSAPRIDYWLHEEGRALLDKLNNQ